MSDAVWIVLVLALAFIFTGEPDLWDVWHAKAMNAATTCEAAK